jgi:hypothetical protein
MKLRRPPSSQISPTLVTDGRLHGWHSSREHPAIMPLLYNLRRHCRDGRFSDYVSLNIPTEDARLMTSALAFNFENRVDREIGLEEVSDAPNNGEFCWVNLTADDVSKQAEFLDLFGVTDEETQTPGTIRFIAQKDCIQFTLIDTSLAK